METFAKDHSYCGSDPGRVIAYSEAKATINPERIAELVVQTSEKIRAGWRIGLRVVLSEGFCV